MTSVEVEDLVARADAFVEARPATVLRAWERHRRRLRFEVGLPFGLEAPLRPLFVERALVDELITAAAPGLPPPAVAMPMGAGTRGALTLTEPPHGREWLLHAAYVQLLACPWLPLLDVEPRHLDAGAPLSMLATALGARRAEGSVAILLGDDDVTGVFASDARVLQLVWFLEEQLTALGVPTRAVTPDELVRDGAALRFDDGHDVVGIASWVLGRPALDDWPRGVQAWPGRGPVMDRRALASFAGVAGGRYAEAQLEAPTAELDDWVFKPFDQPWIELPASQASGAGVFQRRVELPRTRLPVSIDGVVQWRECGVELGAVFVDGRCAAAFGRCVFPTPEGPLDVICPAVLVE